MDPLSQAALGAAAAQSGSHDGRFRHALWIGALAGMAPDLDIFIRSSTDPLLFLEFHRQFTHSLLFIPIGALICALAFYPLAHRHLSFKAIWFVALLGYATHGLLDACTTYGTQLFWPLSHYRVAWNTVSVIDPLFTLPLVALVLLAHRRHSQKLAIWGLCWALGYLGLGVIQHQRALTAAEALVASRGHTPVRLEVKPGFANLLLWKAIYEFEDRYVVDAIRTGLTPTVIPGDSVAKLNLSTHFPWLTEGTQQARDVERFRWFSDNWLAIDNVNPQLIVDMRYSQLPNAIKGLWGVELDQNRAPDAHVRWVSQRATGRSEFEQLWAQLRGESALALHQSTH